MILLNAFKHAFSYMLESDTLPVFDDIYLFCYLVVYCKLLWNKASPK